MLPYFLQLSWYYDVKSPVSPILLLCNIRNDLLDEYAGLMIILDYFNDQDSLLPLILFWSPDAIP